MKTIPKRPDINTGEVIEETLGEFDTYAAGVRHVLKKYPPVIRLALMLELDGDKYPGMTWKDWVELAEVYLEVGRR